MDFQFLDAWDAFLPGEAGHVVAVFGGGGKTSLLQCCAAALRRRGVAVAATTTTRTEPLAWPDLEVCEWSDVRAGRQPAAGATLFVRDGVLPDGKWNGLAPGAVGRLAELPPGRVVLVEADGSAGLPVKLHREGEPVWPGRTSLAIATLGLSAIGEPTAAVLHRHGRLPADWLPEDPQAPWTWDLMFRLLAGPGGYLARVPAGVPPVVALLQMRACADSVGLFGFLGRVMGEAGVPLVLLGEAGSRPSLRTACHREEDR